MGVKNSVKILLCATSKALGTKCPAVVVKEVVKEIVVERLEVEKLPILESCGTIDINIMSSILLDKLEEMDCTGEIYLPDNDCKTYVKNEVLDHYALAEISGIVYIPVEYDCDDFAALLFGEFAGLVWTNTHALNWFIDENETFWFVEPQTGQLALTLEDWQGTDIKFFVGR